MTTEKVSLRPLQEFLMKEVELDELIKHLDTTYYCFTECALKASNLEDEPICDTVVVSRYWIERLKQIFEEIKQNESLEQ
jgi:hypothetical protein